MRKQFIVLIAGILILSGCGGEHSTEKNIVFNSIAPPADSLARYPHLLADKEGSRLWMSWLVQAPDSTSLWMAALDPATGRWQQPVAVASGKQLMVNWADYPHLIPGKTQPDLLYLKTTDASLPYAYHVMYAGSGQAPQRLHSDSSATEHGFVSAAPLADGSLGAVWLDGQKYAGAATGHDHGHGGEMSLRFRAISASGELLPSQELDGRTCDCCNTAMVSIPDGAMIFYRDRSEENIRDISYVRYQNGQWSTPKPLHPDGWETRACPVNGPAADARDEQVVVAWFTGAGGNHKVKLRFSSDAGNSWGAVIVADSLQPIGRVGIQLLEEDSALLSWLNNRGELCVRVVQPGGQLGTVQVLADSLSSRQSGFPQLVRLQDKIYLAWTQPKPYTHVKLLEGVLQE